MTALASRFVEESSLELHSFLSNDIASVLAPRLRDLDTMHGLGADRAGRVPPYTSGTSTESSPSAWTVKGPPHKWRYCTLLPHSASAPAEAVTPLAASTSSDVIIRTLQDELFPSPAFRAWLAIVSRLVPLRYAVEARRFRPGLDYTLATSEEGEARLDVVLGLTPDVLDDDANGTAAGKRKRKDDGTVRGWQAAEWGGWECYMAPHDEEDDPAVYRAGTIKKHKRTASSHTNGNSAAHTNGDGDVNDSMSGSDSHAADVVNDVQDSSLEMEEEEEEEDSTLLTVQPGFNRLLLVLRDERVMRFVKYVSASAEGSRWDVCGEYEIGMMEEQEEQEQDEED